MARDNSGGAGPASATAKPPRKKVSRLRLFLVVCVLVLLAFGGGLLWGYLLLRDAQEDWQKERDALQGQLLAQEKEVAGSRLREALWQLDRSMSAVLIDMAEKNYGLARDEVAALKALLAGASADLPEEAKARIAPLAPVVEQIERGVTALTDEARTGALQGREILRRLLAETGAAVR